MEPLLIMWIRAADIRVALSSDEIGRPIKKKEVKREKKKKTEKKKIQKGKRKIYIQNFFPMCNQGQGTHGRDKFWSIWRWS